MSRSRTKMSRGSRTSTRRALERLHPELEVVRRERGVHDAASMSAAESKRRVALLDQAVNRMRRDWWLAEFGRRP